MATTGGQNRNTALIGVPDGRLALATPALLVDLDVLERNLALVAERCAAANIALRPHVKGHKCLDLARLQLARGAIGLACATLAEAELMAGLEPPSLLLTSPIAGHDQAARLIALAGQAREVLAVVDEAAGVEALVAAGAGDTGRLRVLVDLDVGQKRTGIPAEDIEAIRDLARRIDQQGLTFAGLQAYYGHLQGIGDHDERTARARAQQALIRNVIAGLNDVGRPPSIVSGGGTGTLLADSEGAPFTELQPGSYPFLDGQYGRETLTPDARPWLESSLFVRGRVVSARQGDRVTIDAGMKAVSTDGGPPELVRPDDVAADYAFAGDEHGFLVLREGSRRPALGEAVELVPGHCDTTVNLHGALHAVRGRTLEAIWPIGARGNW